MSDWIKTSERLPEKPGKSNYEYVDCWIFHKGQVKQRPWNCEHQCFDDQEYDDFFCSSKDVSHWMPFVTPAAPTTMSETSFQQG